jgi:hypothetical protein
MKYLSIQEYHAQFPQVTAVPSLTQSDALAAMLYRIDLKRLRRERRRAFRQKVAQSTSELTHALKRRLLRRGEVTRTADGRPTIA